MFILRIYVIYIKLYKCIVYLQRPLRFLAHMGSCLDFLSCEVIRRTMPFVMTPDVSTTPKVSRYVNTYRRKAPTLAN